MLKIAETAQQTVKHTPGPWEPGHIVDDAHTCNCRYIFGNEGMGSVAIVSIDDGSNECPPLEEAKANARLIAAAPDMLDALNRIVGILTTDLETHLGDKTGKKIRAAIAKAEGRTLAGGRDAR